MGKEDIDGVEAIKVKLTRKSGSEAVYFFDPKTYYVIRVASKIKINGQDVDHVANLSNYTKLPEGIVVPFTY